MTTGNTSSLRRLASVLNKSILLAHPILGDPRAVFRAEKRSAQASAHPLPQAQGGLFCVLTDRVDCVCLLLEF